jgi:DNA (cytosine-5)-methyltransferase 1
MKILNLYACLGGNRYKWDEVTDVEVTAVEWDEDLAKLYQERFPNDTVIVADAHQYLLDHYQDFDFIWSSPPCPTHSKMRLTNTGEGVRKSKATYPDMKLYEEIIFLEYFFKGKYCVENVIPYYQPLIPGKKRGRHLYWSNFNFPNVLSVRKKEDFINSSNVKDLSLFHDYDFDKLSMFKKFTYTSHKGGIRIDKIGRNLVDYEAGKTILETALGIIKKQNEKQTELF